ncbi:AP2/B3-like transcriptional factor family protein [Prunus dulcis]|uniref:AP2/B3-like transcriptional factor family protein n=1 Tax=Prunus dulcis TaxID=3755 RepID=A0A4Y1RTB9_PRUDU|nr:AP2/B3-like transcriptional factor family protein [Prunus dulcis]
MEETNEEDDDKSIEGLESLEYFPLCPKTQIEETGLDDDNKSVENLEYFPLCPKQSTQMVMVLCHLLCLKRKTEQIPTLHPSHHLLHLHL